MHLASHQDTAGIGLMSICMAIKCMAIKHQPVVRRCQWPCCSCEITHTYKHACIQSWRHKGESICMEPMEDHTCAYVNVNVNNSLM